MTYSLNIDQEFAILNSLSLVQVSTLAAFMTLPIWAKTVAIDGYVWYQYSDEKMAEDFPLLFGCAKRCYKNVAELADMGFVELTKLGRVKYVRFTTLCASWNKQKEQIWTESPKTDQKESENGPKKSPKTDQSNINYNINNYNINTNREAASACGDAPAHAINQELFPDDNEQVKEERKHAKRTSERRKILFVDSKFFDYDKFAAEFQKDGGMEGVDIYYYYQRAKNWSAAGDNKKKDWIATVRNWMMDDAEKGKLHRLGGGSALSPDAIEYLQNMAD